MPPGKDTARGGKGTIGQLSVVLTAQTSALKQGLGEANNSLRGFNKTALRVGREAGRGLRTGLVLATGAATAATAAITALTVAGRNNIRELRRIQDTTKLSARGIRTLQIASREVGVELKDSTDAIREMQIRLGELQTLSSGPAKDALNELGVSIDDLSNQSTINQFDTLINKLRQVENINARQFLGEELFGGDFERIDAFIKSRRDTLEKAAEQARKDERQGDLISNVDLATNRLVESELKGLRGDIGDFAAAFTAGFDPSFVTILEDIRSILTDINARDAGQFTGLFAKALFDTPRATNEALEEFFQKTFDDLNEIGQDTFEGIKSTGVKTGKLLLGIGQKAENVIANSVSFADNRGLKRTRELQGEIFALRKRETFLQNRVDNPFTIGPFQLKSSEQELRDTRRQIASLKKEKDDNLIESGLAIRADLNIKKFARSIFDRDRDPFGTETLEKALETGDSDFLSPSIETIQQIRREAKLAENDIKTFLKTLDVRLRVGEDFGSELIGLKVLNQQNKLIERFRGRPSTALTAFQRGGSFLNKSFGPGLKVKSLRIRDALDETEDILNVKRGKDVRSPFAKRAARARVASRARTAGGILDNTRFFAKQRFGLDARLPNGVRTNKQLFKTLGKGRGILSRTLGPGVLFEIATTSNTRTPQQLQNEDFQRRLARRNGGLIGGILDSASELIFDGDDIAKSVREFNDATSRAVLEQRAEKNAKINEEQTIGKFVSDLKTFGVSRGRPLITAIEPASAQKFIRDLRTSGVPRQFLNAPTFRSGSTVRSRLNDEEKSRVERELARERQKRRDEAQRKREEEREKRQRELQEKQLKELERLKQINEEMNRKLQAVDGIFPLIQVLRESSLRGGF